MVRLVNESSDKMEKGDSRPLVHGDSGVVTAGGADDNTALAEDVAGNRPSKGRKLVL
jgi:hypothetical protein